MVEWIAQHRANVGLWVWVGALVGLGLTSAPVIVHWRHRRRASLADPARLLDPMPRPLPLYAAALALALPAGITAAVAAAPLPVWAAAIVCFGVAHLTRWRIAAASGVGLLAAGCVAWGQLFEPLPARRGVLLGAAGAVVVLASLGRYWSRQLHNRHAWTTAGRLVPYCYAIALITGIAAVAVVCFLP